MSAPELSNSEEQKRVQVGVSTRLSLVALIRRMSDELRRNGALNPSKKSVGSVRGKRLEIEHKGTLMNTFPCKAANERLCNQGHGVLAGIVALTASLPVLADSQTPAPRTGRDTQGMETVYVTAQRRSQQLQDVPISITALNGEELDQTTLTGVHEILSRVPGMALTRDGDTNGMQLTLRGVTAAAGKFGGASPIAFYLDSVPFGFVRTAFVPDVGGYDLDRIEVLRGPQGTLYGAGGENGVVRVVTHDADLDQYEFKARTGLSSMTDGGTGYRGDAALNVPIVEGKLAVRAVVGYQQLPGWIDRVPGTFPDSTLDGSVTKRDINEGNQRNLRLKLLARPTEQLSIGLSAWNSRTRFDAPQLGNSKNRSPAVRPEPMDTELDVYALKVDYDFAAFSVSSMSSYVDYASSSKSAGFADFFGGVPTFDTNLWSEVFSQEVLLNSRQEGPWRWSGGVFYRDAEDLTQQAQGAPFDDYSDFSEQMAVFGEVGRRFANDRWEWALGLRYFHDKAATRSNDNTIPTQANLPLTRIGDSFDALTPRAVLTWHPREDFIVYASYAQGFRSGSAQTPLALNLAPEFPAVNSDKLHNFEVGTKGAFFDGRIYLETAVYFIDWHDTQQVLFVEIPNTTGGASVLANASSASGLGFDLALTARPLKGLEFGASFSTNDLTFDDDVVQETGLLFSKGDRLASSPKYTINPFVAYSFPLGASGYQGTFSGSASYTSPVNTKRIGDPNGIDGESITLARAGFELTAPQHWSVGLSVDNLSNYDKSPAPLWNVPVFQFYAYRERPRTVNLQFDYEF